MQVQFPPVPDTIQHTPQATQKNVLATKIEAFAGKGALKLSCLSYAERIHD